MDQDDERGELVPIENGFLLAVAPGAIPHLRRLSDQLSSLTGISLTPPVSLLAALAAVNQQQLSSAWFESGGWQGRANSPAFVNAVAAFISGNHDEFAALDQIEWLDSNGFAIVVIGSDKDLIRQYANAWTERNSPLTIHQKPDEGYIDVRYRNGRLEVDDGGIMTLKELAITLSKRFKKSVTVNQVLFALVEDNQEHGDAPLSKEQPSQRIRWKDHDALIRRLHDKLLMNPERYNSTPPMN